MKILLGVIADDFTGATDIANVLTHAGLRVLLVNGIPKTFPEHEDVHAIVVALKTRSVPTQQAIDESLQAAAWLNEFHPEQFFFKYCSTFDSTSDGNIGPVADALLEALDAEVSIVCPAFPKNGRTVYQGLLFVFDQLLSHSPMRHHPLTPMTNSNLIELMDAQSKYTTGLVNLATVESGRESVRQRFEQLKEGGHRYFVLDAVSDAHISALGEPLSSFKFLTGGSAIATGLPKNYLNAGKLSDLARPTHAGISGRKLVLAGSCSTATRAQISAAEKAGWATLKLDTEAIATDQDEVATAMHWLSELPEELPALIYASADPFEVAALQEKFGRETSGVKIEACLSAIAVQAIERGVRQLIVAGGETSGAVTQALSCDALHIGQEIDPGVPWTKTLTDPAINLALKSGNFGTEDFFIKAFEVLS